MKVFSFSILCEHSGYFGYYLKMVGFKFGSCGRFKMMGFKFKSSGYVFAVAVYWLLMISVAKVTDPAEVSALLAVKGNLVDPMHHLDNWNKGDPCTSNWTGVICVHKSNVDKFWHVQEIQLLNMNLSGRLAPELGQFPHLKILDFMWNNLTGSIPKEIGNISSLVLLLLNGNRLTGSLPVELGYLTNLDRFQIDQNEISGPIPISFSNLKNIKHIHFNNNSLTGQIPAELSNLSTLMHLLLDNNNLSGYLPPEFGVFPNLHILQLDNNHFNGEILSSYGNLSELMKLSLRNCSLQGVLPDLSRIPNLSYIKLGSGLRFGQAIPMPISWILRPNVDMSVSYASVKCSPYRVKSLKPDSDSVWMRLNNKVRHHRTWLVVYAGHFLVKHMTRQSLLWYHHYLLQLMSASLNLVFSLQFCQLAFEVCPT